MFKSKNTLLTTIVATAVVGLGAFSMNSMAADGIGSADVVIVAPLTITPVAATQLNFGELSGDASTASTATVTTAGVLTAALPAKVTNGAAASQGQFTVTGGQNLTFATTLPASTTVTSGVVADDMTVDNFTSDLALTGVSLGAGGSATMNIGARLNLAADQPANSYTGTYTVTVLYE